MGVRGRLLSRPALHLFLLAVEAVEDAREVVGWDSLEESGEAAGVGCERRASRLLSRSSYRAIS